MKVYYFGNPYIEADSLAIKVVEKLKNKLTNIEFMYIKDTFQLMDMDLGDSMLIDVANGIKNVQIVDPSKVKSRALSSLHDFDLGFFIHLTGAKVKLLVIPIGYDEDKAISEAREILTNSI